MDANISAILYLVSGVFFIMALRGLSSPETSRQGNYFGIVGMTIAVATTLLDPSIDMSDPSIVQLVVAGIVIGGVIGSIIARRISMTAMPQLVAAFHSLVGL
ncbi:MAG: NAD(P)(+) transhydrogenase (Re/Si-specific) subunit beta, partial [Pseudomonadota bacterium]|nr:NAD(P)(+) transhydrogenase (Re/Si-specific) subunit beta [Pseudomonadota bacterium]